MNIVLLAAGKGKRFTEAGYDPKPLIEVNGLPMWQSVLENFLTQLPGSHSVHVATKEEYNLSSTVYNMHNLKGDQYGAAHSALQITQALNQAEPLFILNCDQFIKFDGGKLMDQLQGYDILPDGCLLHFYEPNKEEKWGRSVLGYLNYVQQIVEKTPVSPFAHTGHYYYKHTGLFTHYAQEMMKANDRVNGEFFISPTFNHMIRDGADVSAFFVEEFHGIGIPDDLERYKNGL